MPEAISTSASVSARPLSAVEETNIFSSRLEFLSLQVEYTAQHIRPLEDLARKLYGSVPEPSPEADVPTPDNVADTIESFTNRLRILNNRLQDLITFLGRA